MSPFPRQPADRPDRRVSTACGLIAMVLIALSACAANPPDGNKTNGIDPAPPQTDTPGTQCHSGLWLQVLGSGGPELTPNRASASYLLWDHGKAVFLLDTGGGSFFRYAQTEARWKDLKAVLFSHFHADHSVDLTAFIKASWFGQRKDDLPLLGPWGNSLVPDATEFLARNIGKDKGAWAYLSDFYDDHTRASYRIKPHALPAAQAAESSVFQADGWRVYAHRVTHGPLPALAWRLEKNGHVLVYSGDTTGEGLAPLLKKPVSLFLAHNAIPQNAGAAARSLHMTPDQIGKLAALAQPQLLVLSHRMHRSLGQETQTAQIIARKWPGAVQFADDLDTFCLP